MKEIIFDYKIDLKIIESERKDGNIKAYDIDDLKGICNGRMFIFFDHTAKKERTFMLLETGIIDYLLQFDMLYFNSHRDGYEGYLVSCDYYSNSIRFKFSAPNTLNISEGNGGIYTINCNYTLFKKAYEKFRKKVVRELLIYYPELIENIEFREHFL